MPAVDSGEIPTCHGGLENLEQEYDYWLSDIDGTVPTDLRGTFVRNGPGRQKIGGQPLDTGSTATACCRLSAVLNMYRISPAGGMTRKGKVPLEGSPFAHDYALTDRYAVFINSIVFANMGNFFLGRSSISDQVGFDDSLPMRIEVVDLDTLEVVRNFETDPGAIIHFGKAFESGNEIVVDGMHASDFEANKVLSKVFGGGRFNRSRHHRFRLNMKTGELSRNEVSEHESEFPVFNLSMHGRQQEVTYTITSTPNGADTYFNGFQRVTFEGAVQQATLEPGFYASEPMFTPRFGAAAEDDGYILMVIYDAFHHRSELQIYRAQNIDDHVATLRLSHHLPHQFHGFWHNDVLLNEAKYRYPAA